MRLRHLPAPGGESAVTEEEAPPGLAGGARPRWHPYPKRRRVRGSGTCRAFRGSVQERVPRLGGSRAWEEPGRLAAGSVAALPALDYTSHRPPRLAP